MLKGMTCSLFRSTSVCRGVALAAPIDESAATSAADRTVILNFVVTGFLQQQMVRSYNYMVAFHNYVVGPV
jgi:hypothetical protein